MTNIERIERDIQALTPAEYAERTLERLFRVGFRRRARKPFGPYRAAADATPT